MASTTARLGDREVVVGDFMLFKFTAIAERLAQIGKEAPEIIQRWGKFVAEYERDHQLVLDRASARRQLGPQPIYEPVTGPDGEVVRDNDGYPILEPKRDEHGEFVFGPDRLRFISDQDWEGSGHEIRLPQPPPDELVMAAVFPFAFEVAKDHILDLAALVITPDSQLEEREGQLDKLIKEQRKFLDHRTKPGEVLKLAVATKEALQEEFRAHRAELGKLREGWSWVRGSENETEQTTPQTPVAPEAGSDTDSSSSTGSQASTGGAEERSSIAPRTLTPVGSSD